MYKKILVIVLIVSIVPALVGTLHIYSVSLITMDSTIGNYLEERTHILSKTIDESLRDTITSFQNLSRKPNFLSILEQYDTSHQDNTTNTKQLLSSLVTLAAQYKFDAYTIIVCDSQGLPVVSTHPEIRPSFVHLSWWKAAIKMNPFEVFFAEEQISENESPDLILVAPVLKTETSSTCDAFIIGIIPLDTFLEKASFIQSEERWSPGIFSSRGHILTNPSMKNKILPILQTRHMFLKTQISTWFPTQEINNTKHIVAFSTVNVLRTMQREGRSNCEWFTFIVFDASEVVVLINLLIWRISLWGLILVVFLIVLGLYLSSRIVKPIKQLHQGMRDISRGDLESRVEIHTGDELEDLAEGFNDMALKLRETYKDLQNKVIELNAKAQQISLTHEITQAINSALDLDNIFTILAEEMKKIVDYEYIGIALLGEDRKEIQSIRIFPGSHDLPCSFTPFPVDGTLLEKILGITKPIIKSDLSVDCENDDEKNLMDQGILSYIIIPLLSNTGIIGIISLGSGTKYRYSAREADILIDITDALSVAVEHSRLYTRVMRFAEDLEEKVKERTLELEEANRKFILTEKFAASGKMAAGVAHEINNPLGIIKNYLKLFNDQWVKHSTRLELLGLSLKPLEIVNEELDRIARIVRNLLDIFRPAEGRRIPTDVNKEINRLIELMKKNLEKKGIQVLLDMESPLPHPTLSPDLFRQVLLNIIGNAEEAILGKGEINIQTRFLGAGTIGKKYIEVVIKDTGCGITPENMGKIFDPFFSTKKEGESTGLGLSVTYSILKNLGGEINIASDPGFGTRVRILLPYVTSDEKAETE